MQSYKLEDLIKDIEVPKELKDTTIFKTDANSEKRSMEVTLVSYDLVPYDVIEEYKKAVCERYGLSEFILRIRYESLSIDDIDIDVYYKNLVFYVNEIIGGVRHLFLNSRAEYSEGIFTIHCMYGVDMLGVLNCAETIKRLIKAQLKADVEVVFKDESSEEERQKLYEAELSALAIEPPPVREEAPKRADADDSPADEDIIMGKDIRSDVPVKLKDITEDMGQVVTEGKIITLDTRELKSEKTLLSFILADNSGAYSCKAFLAKNKAAKTLEKISKGMCVKIKGKVQYDTYAKENIIMIGSVVKTSIKGRMDNAKEKRVELHMHTKMSTMDGMTDAKDLVKNAIAWGHKAVAVTDHGNVQSFPEAMHAAGDKIKVIYGVECYLVNDTTDVVYGAGKGDFDSEFVVFDIETTGLRADKDAITEIGAVKVKGREITDRFQTFVNPMRPIPRAVTELTGITDDMVKDAPAIDTALKDFYDFIGSAHLVAHNASFDTSFIKANAKTLGMDFNFTYIDTLELARCTLSGLKNYKLDTLTKHFQIKLVNHHRAIDDAAATGEVFIELLKLLSEKGVEDISDINLALAGKADIKSLRTYHCILLVKSQKGMQNLYKLISKSHLDYFHRHPRVPKSVLQKYREGLLVGAACEAGEVYRTILDNPYNLDYDGIRSLINFYDYMEIQPLGNNAFMLREGLVESEEDLKYINRTIIELGRKSNKLTVATCDVHFLNPEDEVYRRILMAGQGFEDADQQAPLYFRTTEEMLSEFSYLGDALAREVVIENTNKIADMIEEGIVPIPPDKAPPEIPNSDEILRSSTYEKAQRIYGENLPQIVKDRIDVELNSIISNGYSVLYVIAQKLVRKSNSDGYVVGSRGSVGSSLVAYMSDITEVNSLCPHYVCPECKHSEFINDGSVGSGCDMEDKICPECGTLMLKDGHDIPFETFLGFSGDKEPDIDLNFSGDYQGRAHKYIEELFGKSHVFRAGTIGTVAEKPAYGFVKKYFEAKGEYVSNAEVERLLKGCTGVKRTTGQHPGGIIVVPSSRDVHEFSPIQHPADDTDSDIITLHFDYHSIDTNLLKLDILGHDDPTVIRMLRDLTGIDPVGVPMNDPETMSLFTSTKALGVTPEAIGSPVGTFAVPEFGTKFVRQMLVDTKPTTFSELVRISGLSHGTDVWLNNAQDLILAGTCTLKDAICTRDDIMVYLIHHGVENAKAFKIMESVRKGKGLTEEFEEIMRANDIPEWYIDSCKKIKYMFPKAHAVAYVTSAYRIAYFKVHYPKEFYCSYFTVRADEFDAEVMAMGEEHARECLKAFEAKEAAKEISDKEKRMITILELVVEMYARGISFDKIDLYKSHATKFVPTETGILPPLNALPGVGTNAAIALAEARGEEKFDSIDDLQQRSKVNKTVIEVMRKSGILDGLPESSQMDFFSMF